MFNNDALKLAQELRALDQDRDSEMLLIHPKEE